MLILDLIDFPTIIFFQSGYKIDTLRQASRRSWRLGQYKPVRVYFFCYDKTFQSTALSLIAQKLDCALTVEGDLVDKGLVALTESSNSLIADLTNSLVSKKTLNGVSAEQAWAGFRKKEITSELALGEKEKSVKADIIMAPVNKDKTMDHGEVENIGDKVIKVTIYETKKKKTVTYPKS